MLGQNPTMRDQLHRAADFGKMGTDGGLGARPMHTTHPTRYIATIPACDSRRRGHDLTWALLAAWERGKR